MIKQMGLLGAALAMTAGAVLPATAADAQRYGGRQYDRSQDGRYQDGRGYDARQYRGDDSYARDRARQKCKDGDGGTIIGAIAGGLLGRVVAGRNDHLLGTVLGAGGGALAGRAIDRSDRPEYCRR